VQQDEIIVDGSLLSRTFRRQLRLWLLLGPLFFGLLSGGGGALALLGGGGGASRRYIGVLKSRALAASVERHVQLSRLYPGKFRTEDDAVTFLTKSIKPDDNADGLLYIAVTLPGPPKIALGHAGPGPAQIEAAAAQCADAYALALKEYYATSDTDQGAALLRGADRQERQARDAYQSALGRVLDFNRGLQGVDPRSAPAAPTDTPGSAVATSGLAGLYAELSRVQVDLKAQQTARQTREAGVAQQLNDLSDVPTDDPLLADARQRFTQAQTDYASAFKLYGPENPNVVRAQTARLGKTRQLSGQFGRLEAEVQLRLGVLQTTLAEGAKIRLDNASALSRMTILDPAFPPQGGEPGVAKLGAVCLILVLLAFLAAVVGSYLRAAGAGRTASGPGPAANGTGPHLAAGAPEVTESKEMRGKR